MCCIQVDLTDYEKSGTWDVVGVPGEIMNVYDSKERVNISRANYTIVMRRKTLYYATNLILPCVLVSCLTMIVFYLPATAGEKMTFSVSILLALVVFLQVLVTKLLPPTSLSLPLFAKYLLFTIIIDVFSILNTIIALNWNWKTPRTDTMPGWMRTFFFKYLARLLMMQRPGQTEVPAVATSSACSTPSVRRMVQASNVALSDVHHPQCHYANVTLRHVEPVERSNVMSKNFNKAIEAARFIAAHLKNANDFDEVRNVI